MTLDDAWDAPTEDEIERYTEYVRALSREIEATREAGPDGEPAWLAFLRKRRQRLEQRLP